MVGQMLNVANLKKQTLKLKQTLTWQPKQKLMECFANWLISHVTS